MESEFPKNKERHSPYGLVFLVLAVLTAIEVGLTYFGLPPGLRNTLFIVLSLTKAGLVAAYYMHLKGDPLLYTYLLVVPSLLLAVFAVVATLS